MATGDIRVLLGSDLPRLVSDMVERALRSAEGVEFVGHARHAGELADAIRRTDAQAIVLGVREGAELPDEAARWVQGLPRLIGIAHATGEAHVYVMRPQHVDAGSVTADEVPQLIRALEGVSA
jgi:hypothetical protein